MISEMEKINQIFYTLDDWRNLPNYQLERRADIFFAIYLEEIIEKKVHHKVTGVIPEFPVRIGSIYEHIKTNKSFKIDYVVFCESAKTIYLVELKTDTNSVRPEQIKYLEKTKGAGFNKIIIGLFIIKNVTNKRYKDKYKSLLSELVRINLINSSEFEFYELSDNIKIEILYILPSFDENENPEIEKESVITFEDVINSIKHHQDDLTQRFIQSLELWKNPPNYNPK